MSKLLFVKAQDNLSGFCITRWMNTRTYWSSYQTRTRQDLFIFIQKLFYCDLFTWICEFLTIHHKKHQHWKGNMCFSNIFKWFRCVRIRGHRTWRRDFPTVDCLETCIYLCHAVEINSWPLFWELYNYMFITLSLLFKARTQQIKYNFVQK